MRTLELARSIRDTVVSTALEQGDLVALLVLHRDVGEEAKHDYEGGQNCWCLPLVMPASHPLFIPVLRTWDLPQ